GPAPLAKPTDWFTTIASLPALAVRGIAGPAPASTQRAAGRAAEPVREPPPPVVVDSASAHATAIALLPTPEPAVDGPSRAAPVGGGTYATTPTPFTRRPNDGQATRSPSSAGPAASGTPGAMGTPTPVGTPGAGARRSAADNSRAL